ncbi:MAG TPA: hypothetical protein VK487_02115 [Candidatus Bathyarchaeia archaeon]|nr:hypothetical protein [Candidatus Bathyarchaeia archaeon]
MKILCVVLGLPKDLRFESIKSVMEQTVPVEMVLLLTMGSNRPTETERDVLKDAYEKIDLTTFDYILKIDGYIILPKDFLERNLANELDIMMPAGCEIVKVQHILARAENGKRLKL